MGYLESRLPPARPHVVRHLRSHVHGGAREMAEDVADLADVLATLGGRRLVFTSSAVLYDQCPGEEPEWLALAPTECSPLAPPRTFYALGKCTQEEMIRVADVDAVILRLGWLMGAAPTMRWDLLPQQMVWTAVQEHRIWLTMPRAWRPILGLGDAVRALTWAETAPAGLYNIASFNLPVAQIAERIAEMTGAVIERPGEPPHVPSFRMDCAKATANGWHPTDTLDGLIEEVIARAREVLPPGSTYLCSRGP